MEDIQLRAYPSANLLIMWCKVGKLAVRVKYSSRLCLVLVVRADHVALSSCHALCTTSSILQIQSFPQVIVIDGCLWHDRSLLIQVSSSGWYELGRLSEPVCGDPMEAAACQTLIIIHRHVGSIYRHLLIIEHESLAALAFPLLHWQVSAWGNSNGKCCCRLTALD